ncbi:hypothetical protein LIER_27766 [Lithospermum erythrorhizon]|uniref:Protein EARLY FLOWERING 4 domain-containing protein n=1 Tax=Lithospermum erythrorhizon TaxID=34254 RepID=A0AAV3RHB8_LITER
MANSGQFGDDNDKEGDPHVWNSMKLKLSQVQSVLDKNRELINQVNENHQSKNHENMVKNVELIQEINNNISKVVSLYSDLSANFSSSFHHHQKRSAKGNTNTNIDN